MVAITIPERLQDPERERRKLHFSITINFELQKSDFFYQLIDHIDMGDYEIESAEDFAFTDLSTIVTMIQESCKTGWHPTYCIPEFEPDEEWAPKLIEFHCAEDEDELPHQPQPEAGL